MRLEEAAALLKEKLNSKTFRRAVGARAAEAIETLVRAFECGVCLNNKDAAEILHNYYVFESRVRQILELYNRITRGALGAFAREMVGEPVGAGPLDYTALLGELEKYREYVFSIARRALKCR
ncbi:MAG: hypothetical protein LM577_04340 [Thermoproteaceae archaeon]|jgi:hypothetical protein|nr:hypothetical protein [Thermoproteaceae archaeon]